MKMKQRKMSDRKRKYMIYLEKKKGLLIGAMGCKFFGVISKRSLKGGHGRCFCNKIEDEHIFWDECNRCEEYRKKKII